MKITRRQINLLVKEAVEILNEEGYDCIKDYMLMGYSRGEAQKMCGGSSSRSNYSGGQRRRRSRAMSYTGLNDSTISDIETIIRDSREQLTDWEDNFLASVLNQLKYKRIGLSPKQDPIIKRILSKYKQDDDPDTNDDGVLDAEEISAMVDKIEDDIINESAHAKPETADLANAALGFIQEWQQDGKDASEKSKRALDTVKASSEFEKMRTDGTSVKADRSSLFLKKVQDLQKSDKELFDYLKDIGKKITIQSVGL